MKFPQNTIRISLTLLLILAGIVFAIRPQVANSWMEGRMAAAAARPSLPNKGELIIFTHSQPSAIAQDFKTVALPQILDLAEASQLKVRVIDVKDGAPAEVKFTPCIVFQNYRGRSFYSGRYTQISKLNNFIRTVRRLPQQDSDNLKKEVFLWQNERALIASPFKITELGGMVPEGLSPEAFRSKALKGLQSGMAPFELNENFNLPRSARSFYLALYPYVDKGGKLSVSLEIYSQFSCVEPIFVGFDSPVRGNLRKVDKAFAKAGKVLRKEIQRQLTSSDLGDGFDPVPTSIPEKSWADLGLALPELPPDFALPKDGGDISIPQKWELAGPVDELTPLLQFQFMAPLDNYAGEVKKLEGSLTLPANLTFGKAKGSFEVETAAVDMGDEMLNAEIYKKYIEVKKYPRSAFNFRNTLSGGDKPLAFGQVNDLELEGEFIMKGQHIPLKVVARIQPILSEDESPRLEVSATFRLRLSDPFGIEGPDGPEPARDTMVFYLNFLMKPA